MTHKARCPRNATRTPTRVTALARWVAVVAIGTFALVALPPTPPAGAAEIDDFDLVFSAQTNGYIDVTGNTVMTCDRNQLNGGFCAQAEAGTLSAGNNNFVMVNNDRDNVASTFNSANTNVTIPAGATVLYAGLWWGAASTAGTTGTARPTGTTTIDFRVPGGSYQTLTPDSVNTQSDGNRDYSAYKDVTSLVRGGGSGTYWGANIKAATGVDRYGGYSLILAIRDPNAPLRDLNVFDGYYTLRTGEQVNTTITGFLAPRVGSVNAEIGAVVYEGDFQLSGDFLEVNGNRVSDSGSEATNYFRSRISDDGANRTDRDPAFPNNLGLDAKTTDITGFLPNGATSANIRFSTQGDFYYPAALTTQIELQAPTIQGTKTVANLSGNTPARIGDTLEYTLRFTNVSTDNALKSVVTDDLPPNITYVPGSLQITSGANQGTKTDAAGDDQAEYLAASRTVRARIGTGATASAGGTLARNATQTVKFRATIDSAAADTTIVNNAQLAYEGEATGNPYTYETADVSTPVGAAADLRITKTDTPDPINAGEVITYTVTTSNSGPNTARNAVVSDTLPNGTTLVSASPSQGTCTPAAGPATGDVRCALGDIANGASATTTIRARVNSDFTGSGVVNVATVSADTSDLDPGNNSASAATTVNRSADIAVMKTTSTPTPAPGQQVSYQVQVTNNGPSQASSVTLNDVLSAQYTGVAASVTGGGSCTVNQNTVDCALNTMAAGASRTITITARLSSASTASTIPNTATASSATPDPVPGNNSSSVNVTPRAPEADVALTKQTLTSPVVPGQGVSYRLTVTNNGPSDARSVTTTDTLPGAVTLTGTNPSQGTCDAAGACSLGTIPAGGTATITLTGTIAPGATGSLTNTARVASPTDSTGGNNVATVTDTLSPRADVAITKTANPNPVVDGNDVAYVLTVTNDGPSTAQSVSVVDDVPGALTVRSATTSTGTCTVSGNRVTCSLGALAPGADVEIRINASTPPGGGAGGTTNTATVSSPTPDPVAGNNSASVTLASGASANITVNKQASAASVRAGDQVTYTIRVANQGPSNATLVTMTDTFPDELQIVSVSSTLGSLCPRTGQRIDCSRATLASGASFTATVVARVLPGTTLGSITNSATAAAATPADPTQSDNTDSATINVTTAADLSIDKSAPATVTAGEEITYTVVIDNDGPSVARDVTLTDTLPPGTSFVSVTGADCALDPGSANAGVCTVGDVPVGAGAATVTVTLLVDADVPDGTVLTNNAQVASSTTDPNTGNNTDDAEVTVGTEADLAVTKSADPERLVAGEEAEYTLSVTNNGPSVARDLELTDDLPDGVTLVEATTAAGTCAAGDPVVCSRESLAPGASWTVTLRVAVDPSVTTARTNSATIDSATADPVTGNDTAEVTSPVDVAGNLQIVKTATPSVVTAGEQITYSLDVVNFGPATMADVTVTDELPAGLSDAVVETSQGICVGTSDITCDLGSLLPEEVATVTITAVLAADFDDSDLTNTAEVDSSTRDTDPADDVSSDTTPVVTEADVSVVKRGSDDSIVPGEPFTYFVDVTNAGPSTARNVEVTDTLPAGLTPTAATIDGNDCTIAGQDVTCELASLDPGQVLVRIDVDADSDLADDDVTNTADVTTATTDPNDDNDSSSVTTPSTTSADVALTKERTSAGPVTPGERVVWTITVTNPEGPSTARGVVVRDQLASGLVDPVATADNGSVCTISPSGEVVCPVDVVGVGDSVAITLSATLASDFTGTLANSATATADTVDANSGNNTDSTSDAVTPSADISLTKTRTSGPVVPGTRVTYDVAVTNDGPSVARSVTVTDEVPAALTNVTATPVDQPGASCTITGTPANDVSCDLGDVAVDETVIVEIAGDLGAGYTQATLANTASAASPTDTTPGNNSDTDTGDTARSADLAITKTRTSGPVVPGSPVSFDLTVRNLGPSDADDAVLTDDLEDRLQNVVVDAPGGVTCTISANPSPNTVTCDLGDLAAGDAPITITIDADVPAGFAGDLDNTGDATSATPDPTPANNTATVDGSASPEADVSVVKTRTTPVTPGTTISWEVVVDNTGPSTARDITLTDAVPSVLTDVTVDAPAGTDCTVGDSAPNDVACTLPDLGPGAAPVVLTISGDLPADFTGDLDNTAVVDSPTDVTPDNNASTAPGSAVPAADVSVTKARTTGPVVPGEPVEWLITIANAGPSVATGITMTDDVDDALGSVATEASAGATCDAVAAGNLITCSVASLAPGASETVTVSGDIPSNYTGTLSNTAVISSPDDTTDDNNTDTSAGAAEPDADLSVTKARTTGPVVPGTTISWEIVLTNGGPSDAFDVTLADDLPDALTNIAIDAPAAASCVVTAGNQVACDLPDLVSGASLTVTISGDLPAGFTGQVDNTVTVDSPQDPDPTNNSATVPGTADAEADVSILKQRTSGPIVAGESITWTLTATNNGPSVARNVTIADDVDDALSGVIANDDDADTACLVGPGNAVSCDLATLTVGEVVTVTITGDIPAGFTGTLDNSATIDAPADVTPTNNTSSSAGDVNSVANVSIIKARTSGPIVPGQPITWTLTVDNPGPSDATSVTVADDVADVLTDVTATASDGSTCTVSAGNVVTCDLGTVTAAEDPIVVTVSGDVPAGFDGTLANTATVDSPDDADPADNSSSSSGTAAPDADVSLSKTRTSGPVVPGTTVVWDLQVDNAGPSVARNVTVADNVADVLTDLTATISGGSPTGTYDCSIAPGNRVSCDLGDLPPGIDPIVITLSGDLPAGFTGDLDNTAEVDSPTDSTPDNNTGTSQATAEPDANITLTKSRTSGPIVPGRPVTWTVTVDNAGPSRAVDVAVTDDVVDRLQNVTATSPDATCTVGAGNLVTCDLGALGVDADTAVITITGGVPAGFTGDLDNEATATSPTDTTPDDNTDDSPGTATPDADVSISKSRTSGPIVPGQPVTWELGVDNAGPSVATDVVVTDDVADILTDVDAVVAASAGSCTIVSGNVVTCDLDDLVPGDAPVVITVTGDLPAGYTGDLDNTATVESPTDSTPDNNSSTSSGTAEPDADISVLKVRTSGVEVPGETVTYTVTVDNAGPSVARDVTVADAVPSDLTGVTASAATGSCTVAGNQVDCDLGDVAPSDDPIVVTISGTLDPAFTGTLVNTATVDSPTDQFTPANNTSTDSGDAVPNADVSLVKERTTDPIVPGAPVSWTLAISNAGPSVATGIVVTDDAPNALANLVATVGDGTGTCTVDAGNEVRCELDELAVTDTIVVTLTGDLPPGFTGALDNTAAVTSPVDTTPANNTSTSAGTAEPTADVSIVKVRDTDPIVPGEPVSWTLTVDNAGPSTARDLVVTDDVDDRLRNVTAQVAAADGTCAVAVDNVVTCDLDDLAPGAGTVVITLTGDVPAGFTGSLPNTATVTSPTDPDGAAGNNTATADGDAAPAADLALAKVRTSGDVTPGESVTWQVTVDNLGPSTATDVAVSDDVPNALADVTATVGGGALVGTCTVGAGNQVTCALEDLDPSADPVVITISGDLPADFTGTLDNTATATSPDDDTPANNTDTSPGTAAPVADVAMEKSRTSGAVIPGESISWTLEVTNAGPSVATDVTVSDDLVDELENLTVDTPAEATCSVGIANLVTCDLDDLAPGADAVVITITADVPADYSGSLDNAATVSSPVDETPGNNTSTSAGTAEPSADVSVTKSRTSGDVVPGERVEWLVRVANAGPSTAVDIAISDDLDDRLTGVTATPTSGSTCTVGSGNAAECAIASLAPGERVDVVIAADVPADFTGDLDNTAVVDSPTDDTPGNNTATSEGDAEPSADLSVTKVRTSGPVVPGTTIAWDVTVSNAGPSTATGVTLDDDVADALTGVTATGSGGPNNATCTVAAGNVVACTIPDLAPGADESVTISGELPADFTGDLDNTAVVDSPVDPDGGNNTSTSPGTATPDADVSILKQRTSGAIVAGESVTWTLTVENDGPSDARSVTVADDLEDALTVVTAVADDGSACTVGAGNQVDCDLGTMADRDVVVITITGDVPAGFTGDLDNTATVDSPTDASGGNNASTSDGGVDSVANVSIVKTRVSGPVTPGQPITWELSVDNAGPSTAVDVAVIDDVNDAITGLVADSTSGSCTVDSDNLVSCDLGSLAPSDDPIIITLSGEVPAGFTGELNNTATVSSPTDADDGDNTSSTEADAEPEADVSIVKTRTSGPLVPGQPVTWELVVDNAGPSTARLVLVEDDVADELENVTAVASAAAGPGCSVAAGNEVTCELGSLGPDADPITITVTGDLPADFTGDLDNTATVFSPTDSDGRTGNNTSTSSGTATPLSDVSLTKVRTSGDIVPGEEIVWTLTIDNAGPSRATELTVTDDVGDVLADTTATPEDGRATCSVAAGNVVTCDVDSLGVDEDPIVITVRGDLPADFTGPADNTATVETSSDPDGTGGNNTSTSAGTAEPRADVSVTKTRTSGTVTPGENVTWEIAVANAGPSTATDVVVTDDVDDALTGLLVAGDGIDCEVTSGNVVTCEVDDLMPGADPTVITIVAGVPADFTGPLANTAVVDSPVGVSPGNNDDTDSSVVEPAADLSATKTRTSGPIVPGQSVTWDVTVTNAGPSTATDIELTDDVHDQVVDLTVTSAPAAGATCTIGAGNEVACDLADLGPGESVVLTLTGDVPPGFTGPLGNTATVTSPLDTTPGNNTGSADGNAQPSSDVSIAKQRTSGPVVPGQPVSWLIAVDSTGPSVAEDVVVTDQVDTSIQNVTATGATCTVSRGNLVSCDLGNLAPAADPVEITITGDVPAGFTGSLDNTASVTSPTDDPNDANDSSTSDGDAQPSADLAISKTRPSGAIVPGQPISFELTVTNDGPSDAVAVEISDDLVDDLETVAVDAPAAATCTVGAGNLVTCSVATLGAGAAPLVLTITADVPADFTGELDNTATVSAATADPVAANNTSTVEGDADVAADVSVTKSRTSGPIVPGGDVEWLIRVSNAGPSTATAIGVTDDVDDALTGVTVSAGAAADCDAVGPGNGVSCSIATLAPGDTVEITIGGSVPADFTGSLDNTVVVDSASDVTPDNNEATSAGAAEPAADVSIDKVRTTGSIVPGRSIGWELTLSNAGPSNATDVTVADDLVDALTGVAVDVDAADGTCTLSAGNEVACDLRDLAPGDVVTLSITADVPADYTGDLDNTATVSSPVDTDPANNSAASNGAAQPDADVTVLKQRTSGAIVAGGPVAWDVTVSNNGPSVARSVTLADNAEDALTGVTAVADDGSTCTVGAGNQIACDFGDLAVGEVVVVTIEADVPSGFTGTLNNTATVASPTDSVPSNNSSTSDGSVDSVANVSIVKARVSGPVVPGQPVEWTLTVDNAGPSDAVDVTVTDDVVDAVEDLTATVDPAAGTCTVATGNEVTCDLGTVAAADDPIVITLTGDVPADFTGDLDNTAEVASPTDADAGDNVSTTASAAQPSADVSITKSRTSGPIVPGTEISWTLVVDNAGPSVATDVVVTDDLVDALTDVSVVSSDGTVCTVDQNNLVTCDLGELDPADPAVEITITADVPGDYRGDLDNTAEVTSPTDTSASNNSATSTGTATPTADVSILKARTSGAIVPGEDVTWELTVDNAGPSQATDVVVTDQVPGDLEGVTATGPSGVACTVSASNLVSCDLGAMDAGDEVVVTISATVPSDFSGALENTASVTSPTDSTPGNNSSTSAGTASPSADLSVAKAFDAVPVPGETVEWTVTVRNDGPSDATSLVVTDQVDDALTDVAASGPGFTCTVALNLVVCSLPSLAAGDSVDLSVTGLLDPDFRGDLANSADVQAATSDPVAANNADAVSAAVTPAVDLVLAKQVGPADPIAGETLTYTVTVTNNGPSTATNVLITDPVAPGLEGVTASTTGAGTCTVGVDNVVECTYASLAVGDTVEVTITAEVPASMASQPISNTATVEAAEADAAPTDNVDTVTTGSIQGANLQVSKNVDQAQVEAGGTAMYRITVSNSGPADAEDVLVVDELPEGVTLRSATSPDADCTSSRVVRCRIDELAAGQVVDIAVEVRVDENYRGEIRNVVTVSTATSETVLDNNSDDADLTVISPATPPDDNDGDGGDGSGDADGTPSAGGDGELPNTGAQRFTTAALWAGLALLVLGLGVLLGGRIRRADDKKS